MKRSIWWKVQRFISLNIFEYQNGPSIYSIILFGRLSASWWCRDYSDNWRKRWLGFHWSRD